MSHLTGLENIFGFIIFTFRISQRTSNADVARSNSFFGFSQIAHLITLLFRVFRAPLSLAFNDVRETAHHRHESHGPQDTGQNDKPQHRALPVHS